METDGFACTLQGLLPVKTKFQLRFTTLVGAARIQDIKPKLVTEQEAMLKSQATAATAPALMGLPIGGNVFPNRVFHWITQRRLLLTNIGQLCYGDVCAAHPTKCSRGNGTSNVDDAHLETCTAVKEGDTTRRHRRLQDSLAAMLRAAGMRVALVDATEDYTTRALLARAGATVQRTSGRVRGGDILVYGLDGLGPASTPTVIDLTVISERVTTNVRDEWPARSAETRKVTKYVVMYDKISYNFRGFAVEIGGRLGPAAEELIGMAQKLWWELKGKKAVPAGSNWTCPSFASYWRQRMVGCVQGATGAMGVARARRVAELRMTAGAA